MKKPTSNNSGVKIERLPSKVALFGGSFDPPHVGHLFFALSLQELVGFDEILWIPNAQNPLKGAPPSSFADRLEMVRRAIAPIPQFSLLDWEGKRPPPSYTIDTVRKLVATFGDSSNFSLLLGADQLLTIHLWREREELFTLAPPTIASRGGVSIDWKTLALKPELRDELRRKFVTLPELDISSTTIRDRISRKKYCGHLLSSSVLDYIKEKKLYSSASKLRDGD
jgi:nicotinate-nucleotide adenylyltransferase